MAKTTAGKVGLGALSFIVPVAGTLASTIDAYWNWKRLENDYNRWYRLNEENVTGYKITKDGNGKVTDNLYLQYQKENESKLNAKQKAKNDFYLQLKSSATLVAATVPPAVAMALFPQVFTLNNLSDHTSFFADLSDVDQLDGMILSCVISFIFTAWLVRSLVSTFFKEQNQTSEISLEQRGFNAKSHALFGLFSYSGDLSNTGKSSEDLENLVEPDSQVTKGAKVEPMSDTDEDDSDSDDDEDYSVSEGNIRESRGSQRKNDVSKVKDSGEYDIDDPVSYVSNSPP